MQDGIKQITQETVFTGGERIALPVNHIPLFRSHIAIQNGVEKNLLFKTWGGLGDQICAEPTLRYALKHFKNAKVSLASEKPELFRHLKFESVYDLNQVVPNWKKFLTFETITPPDESNLVWQFFSHMLTNCVDFPSLCALRSQLPVKDKEIRMTPETPKDEGIESLVGGVFVHAGKHWPSKTFPKDWWDKVLAAMIERGLHPILVGANTDDNRGTVDVNPEGCLDLRNKTSVNDMIWLMQRASVLITNDSSPMHMAASVDLNDVYTGQTWIGYIATCKHPDYITHWRRNAFGDLEWQYREENLGLGGMWDVIDQCPNQEKEVTVGKVDEDLLRSWLPDPENVATWALLKKGGHHAN